MFRGRRKRWVPISKSYEIFILPTASEQTSPKPGDKAQDGCYKTAGVSLSTGKVPRFRRQIYKPALKINPGRPTARAGDSAAYKRGCSPDEDNSAAELNPQLYSALGWRDQGEERTSCSRSTGRWSKHGIKPRIAPHR